MRKIAALLVFVVLCAVSAQAAITHGSSATGVAGAAASISSGSITVGANHLLVFTVYSTPSTARVISSVTDASSLCAVSWITSATHANLKGSDALVGVMETVYCYKTNANTGVIQANFDSAVGNGAVGVAQEYLGTDVTADPYDTAPVWNHNTGTPGTSLTVSAPAVNHSLLVTAVAVFSSTNGVTFSGGPVTAVTKDDGTSASAIALGDILDDTGGVTIGATSSHTGTDMVQTAVVFKAAAAGGTTVVPRLLMLGVGDDSAPAIERGEDASGKDEERRRDHDDFDEAVGQAIHEAAYRITLRRVRSTGLRTDLAEAA